MPFFSTIIPVYNRANLIAATLESVLNQTFADYEVIVVDDGSTDHTLDVLQRFGDRITILQQPNEGPGAARNLGIHQAKGTYITFLDSDDLWFPWTLATYKRAIAQYHFPCFITGATIEFQDQPASLTIQPELLQAQPFKDYYAAWSQPLQLLPGNVAIRADALQEAGCFTSQWINGEDSDLWLKLGTANGFVSIQSPPVLAYRRHGDTAISNLAKSVEGMDYLIQQETAGHYPGNHPRQRERLELLTRHIRPVSLECLRRGWLRESWQLYQATLPWHLYLGRIRYLAGYWLLAGSSFWRKLAK